MITEKYLSSIEACDVVKYAQQKANYSFNSLECLLCVFKTNYRIQQNIYFAISLFKKKFNDKKTTAKTMVLFYCAEYLEKQIRILK